MGNAWIAIEHRSKSLGFYLLPSSIDALETMPPIESRYQKKSNMATRQPFWKWHWWKSVGSFSYIQVMCHWNLGLIFKAKLKLHSGNWKIEYDRQAAILKVISLKIYRLLPIATENMHMKFEIKIPQQTWFTPRKPCHLQSPNTAKPNMAARQPFWKWHCWR